MQLIIDFRNSDVSAALQTLSNELKSEILLKIENDIANREIQLTVDTGNDHAFINSSELPSLIDDVIVRVLRSVFGQTITVNTDHFDSVNELLERAADQFGTIFTRLQTEAHSVEFTAKMLVEGQAVGNHREILGNVISAGTWSDISASIARGKQQVVTIMRTQLESFGDRLSGGSFTM